MNITITAYDIIGIYGGFHSHGGTTKTLDGFCERENPSKIDDFGVPPFQETTICECWFINHIGVGESELLSPHKRGINYINHGNHGCISTINIHKPFLYMVVGE